MENFSAKYRHVLVLGGLFLMPLREDVGAQTELFFNDLTPTLESGVDLEVDAVYRFQAVTSGVDALVRITSLDNGATLERIDDHGETTPTDMFYPRLAGSPSGGSSVTFTVSLVDPANSDAPQPLNFRWSLADIDSSGTVDVSDIYEIGILHGISEYTLEGNLSDPSNLTASIIDSDSYSFHTYPVLENFTGVELTDTVVIAQTEYTNTSEFSFGFAFEGTQASNTRNVAASGDPTVYDNFVSPITILVPEPATALLLFLGTGSLLVLRRKN